MDEFANVVVENPLAALPDGFLMQFHAIACNFTDEDLREVSMDWTRMRGIMLAVCFGAPAYTKVLGSAVLVAPGIALCAWHVLADRLDKPEWLTLMSPVEDGTLQIWSVRSYTHPRGTDLVLLNVHLATAIQSPVLIRQALVTARVPAVGEMLTIIGSIAAQPEFATNGTPDGEAIRAGIFISRGPVTRRYIPRRDQAVLPWPCLEVSVATHGGMSGGPVFDERGALVGVLCSSFDTEDGSGPSYVSLLFPALVVKISGGWPSELFPNPQSLLDNQWCSIERRDAFVISEEARRGEAEAQFVYDE